MSPSLPARGLLALINVYKYTLSPLIGQACRYKPTCSAYTAEAIRMHGAWAGSWMGAARICRCAPWGGHGWDPAPLEIKRNSWWRPWRYGDWKGGFRAPPVVPREGDVDRVQRETKEAEPRARTSSAAATTPSQSSARADDSSPSRESTSLSN